MAKRPNVWNQRFALLKEYLKRFGSWPTQGGFYKGLKLGMWCSNQRSRRESLSPEQISLLNSVAFKWTRPDPFLEHFEALIRFRTEHPDRWPSQDRGSPCRDLARWCSKQRTKTKHKLLIPEHRRLLDSLSFPFEDEWKRNFAELRKYVDTHSSWPQRGVKYQGIDLGTWCATQRYQRAKGNHSRDRVALLDSIAFPWAPHEQTWQENYQLLIAYRRKHPTQWPNATEEYLETKLGSWCVTQRQLNKKKKLDASRRKLLNRISFPWEFENVDLTGLRFSRLRVLEQAGSTQDGKRQWLCLCSCGKTTKSTTYRLSSGKHKSCGCLLREKAAARMPKIQRISAEKRLQTAQQIQLRIDKVHGKGTIVLIASTYKDVFSPAKFMHWAYGEWKTKPISVYRGSSHPVDGRSRTNAGLEARRLTEEEIDSRLPSHIRIQPGTFRATSKKATFIDADFGDWEAVVSNVLGGHGHPERGNRNQLRSMEETNLRKYGVKYVAQVASFALKAAEKQNKITKKRHWKTKKTIRCHGGWEVAVVIYLNKNRIDYEWQPKVFPVPQEVLTTANGNQTTYRPDLYLSEEDLWVEIKGYFREDAAKKWAWFCECYPNTELWDHRKLRELGIVR